VHFLDNVIDMNLYPVAEIDRVTKLTRKIGLGVMGWADLLYQLGVPYDSEQAIGLADRVMSFIRDHADAASEALATERGVFPAWEESVYGPSFAHPEALEGRAAEHDSSSITSGSQAREVRRLRNSTRTTIAPTGTLSIIADCSGGIEPAFALAFTRQHYLDPKRPDKPVQLTEVNHIFEAAAKEHSFYSRDLIDYLASGGSLQHRDDVPGWAKRIFVTAHDIAPEWHVRMQAAFQRHTDNAVSKTINFPREASIDDVSEAYRLAFELGCKGITIYRDGSRVYQVLTHVADGEGDLATSNQQQATGKDLGLVAESLLPVAGMPHRRRLPDERHSITHKFRVGEQEGYVTVGLFEDGTPGEIFVTISKEGSTIRGLMDSVAMLTSYALQYGVPLRTLVDKFKGVHFEPAGFTAHPEIPQASSLVDYIFRWLELRFLNPEPGTRNTEQGAGHAPSEEGRVQPTETPSEAAGFNPQAPARPEAPEGRGAPRRRRRGYIPPSPALPFSEIATGLLCPDCGSQLVFAEGCLVCRSCGYTKCG
jgi:ribonucleoside-diphosphate reductase alpha chain